jgi:hypothetical protein
MSGISSPSPIGVGQTWQDVKASRAVGTTYTNTTSTTIAVSVSGSSSINNAYHKLAVNGVTVSGMQALVTAGSQETTVSGLVPPNGTYVVTVSGTFSCTSWAELR